MNATARPVHKFHQVAGGYGCVLACNYRVTTRVRDAEALGALGERDARHSFTIRFPLVCFRGSASTTPSRRSDCLSSRAGW
jgi:hypothetical protein